jgi:hypothetical protein
MFYFDNKILKRFLGTKLQLKVYVGREYLTITSYDDISDPGYGYGIDTNGDVHEFDYRSIQHVLVNNSIIDIETLEKNLKSNKLKSEPKSDDSADDSDTDTGDEETEEGGAESEEGGEGEEGEEGSEEEKPALTADTSGEEGGEEEEGENPFESVRGRKSKLIKFGSYIQNVNPLNEHFGTRGSVVDVHGNYITYSFYSDQAKRVVQVVAQKRDIRVIK